MGNKRFQKHKGGGAKTGQQGMRHDDVSPVKTKMWPGIPGKTQPKTRNFGFRKVPGGASQKGV
jgi:hypothetical protein